MERRMLLAVVLSILAVMSYSAITGRGCMAPPPPKKEEAEKDGEKKKDDVPPATKGDGKAEDEGTKDGKAPKTKKGDAKKKGDAPKPPAKDGDLTSHPQHGTPATRAALESKELTVGFTSQGGAIEFVRHTRAFESDRTTPFDQILPLDRSMLMGQIDDTGLVPPAAPGGAGRENMKPGPMRLPELPWTRDEAAEAASEEDDVVYTFTTPEGLTYRKQWLLGDGERRYELRMRLSVAAGEGVEAPAEVAIIGT